MKLIRTLAVAAIVAAPVAIAPIVASHAAEPGLPTSPYQGDITVQGGPQNQSMKFKLYYEPNRQRMDLNAGGQAMSIITDKAAKTTTMLLRSKKLYAVRPLKPDQVVTDMLRLKNAKYEVAGEEKCGDYTCTKYKASGQSPDGDQFSGFMWYTKDHNILMKIEGIGDNKGKKEKFSLVASNVKIGPINPAVFKVPEGYNKLPGAN